MGKQSTRENKTIYQLCREAAGLTRAEASEKMDAVSDSKIEKFEYETQEPTPYDILQMADAYKKPELCNYYCSHKCEIGHRYVPEVEMTNLSNIILETIASLNEIKKAKNLSARLKIAGKENYSLERSFDVMDKAAVNESGTGAAFINAGLGLGASLNIGKQIGETFMPNDKIVPPPIIEESYFLAVNGKQQGPYTRYQLYEAILHNSVTLGVLAWKKGMPTWQPLSTFQEFKNVSPEDCPPPIL